MADDPERCWSHRKELCRASVGSCFVNTPARSASRAVGRLGGAALRAAILRLWRPVSKQRIFGFLINNAADTKNDYGGDPNPNDIHNAIRVATLMDFGGMSITSASFIGLGSLRQLWR